MNTPALLKTDSAASEDGDQLTLVCKALADSLRLEILRLRESRRALAEDCEDAMVSAQTRALCRAILEEP